MPVNDDHSLVREIFERSIKAHQDSMILVEKITAATSMIIKSIDGGGKVLIMGNGGSAADASHMAAEFVGRFKRNRQPLPAIALTTDTSIITSIANDFNFKEVFVKQCLALVRPGDIIIAISTSGNSENITGAITSVKNRDVVTVALTGGSGGNLGKIVDLSINVPSDLTSTIQEVHRTIIHAICDIIDENYAKK